MLALTVNLNNFFLLGIQKVICIDSFIPDFLLISKIVADREETFAYSNLCIHANLTAQ